MKLFSLNVSHGKNVEKCFQHCWNKGKTVEILIENVILFCMCWKQTEHCSVTIGKRCISGKNRFTGKNYDEANK